MKTVYDVLAFYLKKQKNKQKPNILFVFKAVSEHSNLFPCVLSWMKSFNMYLLLNTCFGLKSYPLNVFR